MLNAPPLPEDTHSHLNFVPLSLLKNWAPAPQSVIKQTKILKRATKNSGPPARVLTSGNVAWHEVEAIFASSCAMLDACHFADYAYHVRSKRAHHATQSAKSSCFLHAIHAQSTHHLQDKADVSR